MDPREMTPDQFEAYKAGIEKAGPVFVGSRMPRKVSWEEVAPDWALLPTVKAMLWKRGFIITWNFWAAQKQWPEEFHLPMVFDIPHQPDD